MVNWIFPAGRGNGLTGQARSASMFVQPDTDPRISELHDLLLLEEDARGNPYCVASMAEAKRYRADALRIVADLTRPASPALNDHHAPSGW